MMDPLSILFGGLLVAAFARLERTCGASNITAELDGEGLRATEDVPRPFPAEGIDVATRAAWWYASWRLTQPLAAMLEKKLAEHAAESLPMWRTFWRIAVRRLGWRGTIAAGLVALDGPLPAGDAIALGLTVWMLYDLYVMSDQIWDMAHEIRSTGQLEHF